jgi:peptidoglycan/LPS O-acetylase OafA/YrhL
MAPKIFGNGGGQLGVAMFFALSGYLMSYLYIDRYADHFAIKQFLRRRILRIFPLYYGLVLTSISLQIFLGFDFYSINSVEIGFLNIFLIKGSSILWTIPVEFQFYLLFVCCWAISTGIQKGLRTYWLWIFLYVNALVLSLINFDPKTLLPWLHFFLMGVLISIYREGVNGVKRISATITWIIIGLVLFGLAVPGVRQQLGLPVFTSYRDPFFIVFICYSLSIFATSDAKWVIGPLLSFFGKVSYSMYLLHMPLINVFLVTSFDSFVFFWVLLIAISAMSWYLIEKKIAVWLGNHVLK